MFALNTTGWIILKKYKEPQKNIEGAVINLPEFNNGAGSDMQFSGFILCISSSTNITHSWGGAAKFAELAEHQKKGVINLV